MKPGDEVIVFTKSGTFTAHRGVVDSVPTARDVRVRLDGESAAMTFERNAIVPLSDSHHAGAE